MKYLVVSIVFCLTVINVNSQIVDIPDANFKDALVNEMVVDIDGDGHGDVDADTNNDGEIQVSEAEAVIRLIVFNFLINSLEGIQSFINLEFFVCNNNSITNLDVSQNINLTYLDCGANLIANLDVSQNTNLTTLFFSHNFIPSLDLSQNTDLIWMTCVNNGLTSLDITQNPNLENLNIGNNLLNEIDVTNNINLDELFCFNNQLESIDLSQNINLRRFGIWENQITSLDFSNNSNLVDLFCYDNQLVNLNVKNGTNFYLRTLKGFNNPNLECIQIDDETASIPECDWVFFTGWCVDATASFSEECILGVDDYDRSSIVLYPNPVEDKLNIQATGEIDMVRIFSPQGLLVMESANSSTDISQLVSGIYFAQITVDGGISSRKFVKR